MLKWGIVCNISLEGLDSAPLAYESRDTVIAVSVL